MEEEIKTEVAPEATEKVEEPKVEETEAPKEEVEAQTKLSSKEIAKSKDIYLKPIKTISRSKESKFNEKFRNDWNFAKTGLSKL